MRDLGLSYEAAAHGIQSAVKYELENGTRNGSDHVKHLRTGLDCRAADAAGLACLLIKKGVFTEEEYFEAMRLSMNEELARYTDHVREEYGLPEIVNFR